MYKYINPSMNRLLRSRWHRLMSKRIMSVSYIGRKSGRSFEVPVSYLHGKEQVYCFTNGSWRHNFATPLAATLRLAGADCPATGQISQKDPEQQVDIMSEYFQAVPQDKKYYGIRGKNSEPTERSQVVKALQRIDIIEFDLHAH